MDFFAMGKTFYGSVTGRDIERRNRFVELSSVGFDHLTRSRHFDEDGARIGRENNAEKAIVFLRAGSTHPGEISVDGHKCGRLAKELFLGQSKYLIIAERVSSHLLPPTIYIG